MSVGPRVCFSSGVSSSLGTHGVYGPPSTSCSGSQEALASGGSREIPVISLLDTHTQLGPWFREAVSQWLFQEWLLSQVPFRLRPPQFYLYTDASKVGWGAHCQFGHASGLWSVQFQRNHINFLELMAVFLALKEFLPHLAGRWVTVSSDNTTSLAYIRNQGGSFSRKLSLLAEELLLWAHSHSIQLQWSLFRAS